MKPVVVISTFLVLLGNLYSVTSKSRDDCRCLAFENCWPKAEIWDAFNHTVGGRLFAPKPTGYPCHEPHFNAKECAVALVNSTNPYWRSSNPGSMEANNWEETHSQQCLISAPKTTTCLQGRVSVLGVQVEIIADIKNAVTFAAKHNLRLVVKSTGHDYLGRSAAAGSFLIWMHKLKNIKITKTMDTNSYRNCGKMEPGARVTVQGGVVWGEVYEALKDTGYVVVGGLALSICATGGYVQGGGHSPFSPSFGLAVDNVLEMEVVTADGKVRTVNACEEAELFFALRGGGGGTFGVVTSVTYKLHKRPSSVLIVAISLSPWNASSSWSSETQETVLAEWTRSTGAFDAIRMGGYWFFSAASFTGTFLVPSTTEAITRTTFTSFVKNFQSTIINATVSITNWGKDWHGAISALSTATGADHTSIPLLLASRIAPYSSDPSDVARAILTAMAKSGTELVSGDQVIGPGVRHADPHGNLTSVTPAFRRGAFSIGGFSSWSEEDDDSERFARHTMSMFSKSLHSSFPDSGAYMNEACIDESEWKDSFWGMSNYVKLVATKARVDPSGLFVCRKCVGSDAWEDSGNCRA